MDIEASHASLVRCSFERNIGDQGGAVVANDSRARFQDCIFKDNEALVGGGGMVAVLGSQVTLQNTQFVSNIAGFDGGGGISVAWDSQVTVQSARFIRNTAGPNGGGGMIINHGSTVNVSNAFFGGNSGSGDGGAMAIGDDSDVTVSNSTIVGNHSPFSGVWS